MALKTLSLSELAPLSEKDRNQRLKEFFESPHEINGEIQVYNDRISGFEKKHGMSSEEMVERLGSGQIKETSDICSWLLAYEAFKRMQQYAKKKT